MKQNVFLSLLALDAYNRGYGRGIFANSDGASGDDGGQRIGNETKRPLGARTISGFVIGLIAMVLAGCGVLSEDAAPDYRYRLTVEVETPEGLKTGSSVIEVQQTLIRPGSSPGSQGVSRKVRGEAVAVDLPGGKTLYALLRSDNNVDWASSLFVYLAGPSTDLDFADKLDDVLEVAGERVVPRTWPPVGFLPERSAYPTMVTFSDETDPRSARLVDPDDLAATFGEEVALKRITAELMTDPVTSMIESRLVWIDEAWSHDALKDGPFYAKYPTVILGLKGRSQ